MEKEEKDYSNCRKKQNQRLKTYLMMQYLLHNTHEKHNVHGDADG